MSGGYSTGDEQSQPDPELTNKKLKTDSDDAASPKPVAVLQPVPQPQSATVSRPKVPTEPIPKMKYLLQQCLEDDDEDPQETATKAWGYVSDVQPEQTEQISAVATTILKYVDDESAEYMGKIVQFSVRLRKWVVAEHNKDKKSPLIPKLLKVRGIQYARTFNDTED
jgi:hypothetical protein